MHTLVDPGTVWYDLKMCGTQQQNWQCNEWQLPPEVLHFVCGLRQHTHEMASWVLSVQTHSLVAVHPQPPALCTQQ